MIREKIIRPWTSEDEATLRALAVRGASRRAMSVRLRRTRYAIYARMKKLGLMADATPENCDQPQSAVKVRG